MLTLKIIAAAVVWFTPSVGEGADAASPTQEPDRTAACSDGLLCLEVGTLCDGVNVNGRCVLDPTPAERAQAEAEGRKNRLRAERAERRAQVRALSRDREQERQRGIDSYRF